MTDEHRTDMDQWRSTGLEGTFEAALATLDEIVAFLETGRHGLDETVAAYELGVSVATRCQGLLAGAELRVSQITVDTEIARRSLPAPDNNEDGDGDQTIDEAPF